MNFKETTFSCDCDLTLRRDEYSDHYALFHDYLLPHAEQIDMSCPMNQYGCGFFQRRIDFFFGKCTDRHFLNLTHPAALIVENETTNCVTFSVEHMSPPISMTTICRKPLLNGRMKEEKAETKSLADLPFEVLFEIIDHMDSLSIFNLSMTCKVI